MVYLGRMTTVRIPPNKKYLPKHKHNYPFQNSTTIERHNGDDSDSTTPLLHRRELIPSTLREREHTYIRFLSDVRIYFVE